LGGSFREVKLLGKCPRYQDKDAEPGEKEFVHPKISVRRDLGLLLERAGLVHL
jgi:hypothetical protein